MSHAIPVQILLVEDDDAVRDVTAMMLEDLGYAVLEADNAAAALEFLGKCLRIDLLMADFAMPGMTGVELAKQVGVLRPDLPVLLVTGYADAATIAAVGTDRIVLKPFRNEDLARKIRTALGAGENGQVVTLRR